MKTLAKVTTLTTALALAACGSDDNNATQQADEQTEAAAAETAAAKDSMMEQAQEIASAATEKAAEVAEALKLDTSSLESFQSSLAAMKGSLNDDQVSQLTSALGSLAKGSASEKGGLMGAAKNLASGKSMEETVYETLGDKLDGLTFEDVLNLAK